MRCLHAMLLGLALTAVAQGAEETLRGVLEQTTRHGACAQLTDALGETYYIVKTDETEKMIAPYVGKNRPVKVVGTAENRDGEIHIYFNAKRVEAVAKKEEPAKQPADKPNEDAGKTQ